MSEYYVMFQCISALCCCL